MTVVKQHGCVSPPKAVVKASFLRGFLQNTRFNIIRVSQTRRRPRKSELCSRGLHSVASHSAFAPARFPGVGISTPHLCTGDKLTICVDDSVVTRKVVESAARALRICSPTRPHRTTQEKS